MINVLFYQFIIKNIIKYAKSRLCKSKHASEPSFMVSQHRWRTISHKKDACEILTRYYTARQRWLASVLTSIFPGSHFLFPDVFLVWPSFQGVFGEAILAKGQSRTDKICQFVVSTGSSLYRRYFSNLQYVQCMFQYDRRAMAFQNRRHVF